MPTDQLFLVVWVAAMVGMLSMFYLRGRDAMTLFPEEDPMRFVFREKRASGRALTSFVNKLGGANKLLEVAVTDDELWLRSPMMMAAVAKRYDLLHRIPLSKVTAVEDKGKRVVVEFRSATGEAKSVELLLKGKEEFLQVMWGKVVEAQLAR